LVNTEAIADGLNPLIISHTARNSSFNIIGVARNIVITELLLNIPNEFATNNIMIAIKPHMDINRGTSLD